MIKKLLVSASLLFSLGILAQEGTASPYSFYGIGDLRFRGAVENRSMGGLSIFPDSIHINLQNPAAHSSLKLTTLALSASYGTTKLITNTQEEKAKRSAVDYIALGFPMGKLGAVVGLMPYSSVGYKNEFISTNSESRRSNGNGGVNKAFLGFGYKINSNWSVGLDFNYNFGQISTNDVIFQTDVQYGTRELNTSNLSGINFNSGLIYKSIWNKKYDFYASFIFTPESTLKSMNERNIATIQYSSLGDEFVIDEKNIGAVNTKIKLPSKFSFGTGIGDPTKWLIGAEFTLQQSNNFSNRFEDITDGTFENAKKYAIGGYYIPRYNSFSSYFERMTYRSGFRYENTGLVIKNKSINDMAITFGVGLPVGGRLSNVNLGVEIGKKGTKASDLVEEKYVNFTISISLNDQWFRKIKYD